MKKAIPSNTRITQFFAYLQMNNKEFITLGDLHVDFQISAKQEQELLSYLARKGSIIRLKRGTYVVPEYIPPGGKWQPDPKYLVSCLMAVTNAQYYISGFYAFHYHGLTEQIPNLITVYNDKLSAKKKLGKLNVQLIKIKKDGIGDLKTIHVARGHVAHIATLTRSIVDAVNDYTRYNTLPRAYAWIQERSHEKKFLSALIKTTLHYGNISTKRRIGFFIACIMNNKKLALPLLKTLKPSKGWIGLDPSAPLKGITNKQWGIINNVKFK